ncbi:methionine aminotransferase [Phaeocystidibacter luteus]|uniref:Aminotransferase class I/II-fold pyridoxal phosphate-dependent enzyme n=1 Tax=Phaeocystidibacter luteus TaxID=911197 RepID=A0A6N6RGK5_9FLAO|nr:methionine aminotransferase [Phaeocystidibacter luteus]KAB2808615.1 aminotransferase class I/II-fold pyridoxal phosphate-dependent enzyme [Phaeocystidibacter luteus]
MQYPGHLSSKLPRVGTTIFTEMSALAQQHNAVNLSQGFPDFDPHPKLIEAVSNAMKSGHNQYAPMGGWLPLRERIAEQIEQRYGTAFNPEDEITITAGATQALCTAMAATITEGDEVILFTPAYDAYAPLVELFGGTPVYVKLQFPDYHIDWDQLQHMISHKTKMIVINNPHNPTGAVLKEEDLDRLERIVKNSNILLLADEVYEHIIFDGLKHQSLLSRSALAERTIAVYSFGKTFHMTGWKLGYAVAPQNLMKEFRKVHQFNVFSVNRPAQVGLAEFLTDGSQWEVGQMYAQKRDEFLKLVSSSRFKALASHGSYFVLMDYSAVTDEPDMEYAKRLTIEKGLASIPVSVFYNVPTDHKVLRFCFAKNSETLERGAEILNTL